VSEYTPQAWRMRGFYPDQYAMSSAALGIGIDYQDDDYDRYESEFLADLTAHEDRIRAEAKVEALREAADDGVRDFKGSTAGAQWAAGRNLVSADFLYARADRIEQEAGL